MDRDIAKADAAVENSPAVEKRIDTRQTVTVLACVALAVLAWWWIGSVFDFRLRYAWSTWLPAWKFLGLDLMHNYLGARAWLNGINPYLQSFGDQRGLYAYPPIVLPLFAWVGLIDNPRVVVGIWVLVISTGCGICIWQIGRFRRAVGLVDVPMLAMLALVLWSAPVMFAMERGNCDVLVLFCVVFAAMAMGKSGRWTPDLVAGTFLALAVMIKIYPLMVVAVLIVLRRWRVLAFMTAGIALIVMLSSEATQQWLAVMNTAQSSRLGPVMELLNWLRGSTANASLADLKRNADEGFLYWGSLHSPGNWWPALWLRLGAGSLASWPLLVAQIVTLAPVTLWGCRRIFLAENPSRLLLPILLWIMTAAIFWMPLSYDYNLIYLPLLIVALWDKGEARWVNAILVTSLLWWLPFGPIGYDWSLARVLSKLLAFHIVTLMLVRHLGLRHLGRDSKPPQI